jgi:hypothetical protein
MEFTRLLTGKGTQSKPDRESQTVNDDGMPCSVGPTRKRSGGKAARSVVVRDWCSTV